MKRYDNKIIKVIVILLGAVLFHSLSEASESGTNVSGEGLLWEVSSDSGTVYILGSVHLFKKELYPLPQKIEKAFRISDTVFFEVDLKELDSIIVQFQQTGMYQEGDSLERHISKETLELVLQKIKESGIPYEIAMKFKPWVLAITIQSLEYQKLGFLPESGIDKYFYQKATTKEVKGFETADYQIGLLNNLSDEEQDLYLRFTLVNLEKTRLFADRITEAWLTGNLKILEEMIYAPLKEDPTLFPIYNRLIFERNRVMASKIEELLKTKRRYFVVIGAGHLAGDQGILELLHRKGYRLKRL